MMKATEPTATGTEAVIVDREDSTHVDVFDPRGRRARVKIGGVYVSGDKASAAQVKRSVSMSSAMLERLGQKITQPGVRLKTPQDVPFFSVDPMHPGLFLRRLNGKTERGMLEDGTFNVLS